ncbi:MAG: ABC transporter ATP-binding protein [Planctomycetes bacterium]|nr:ABC transporter ATP-binding protein [Planctomycetota bacterium]
MKILLESLTKRYGALVALDDLSLAIEPGRIVAVVGRNGAGKSTLLRCLAGISAPDRGAILYDGQVFRRDRLELRRRFAFLPDFPFLFAEMSALRHIGMCVRLYETDTAGIEERVVDILRSLDLLALAELPMGILSRGQRYKAALSALLTIDPELWLLDEPFASGMDPQGITVLKREVRRAAARGRTILYATQLLDVAESFSDEVLVLDGGELKAFASIPALKERVGRGDGSVLAELFRQLREGPP